MSVCKACSLPGGLPASRYHSRTDGYCLYLAIAGHLPLSVHDRLPHQRHRLPYRHQSPTYTDARLPHRRHRLPPTQTPDSYQSCSVRWHDPPNNPTQFDFSRYLHSSVTLIKTYCLKTVIITRAGTDADHFSPPSILPQGTLLPLSPPANGPNIVFYI